MADQTDHSNRSILYVLLCLGVLALALAGYIGYVLYPRFNLPAVTGSGLFVLAAMAGIASTFSPCAFPLLVTLLARETGVQRGQAQETKPPLSRALTFAAALSMGATIFLLLAGAGIAAGAAPLFAGVTFTSVAGRTIRTLVGMVLILLGLVQLGVFALPFGAVERSVRPLMQRQARLRRQRPSLAFGLFGFIYVLAGFG